MMTIIKHGKYYRTFECPKRKRTPSSSSYEATW